MVLGVATRGGGEATRPGEGDGEGDGDVAAGVGEVDETEGAGCPGLTLATV
ncbi:MAG: hypothetical protein ACHP7P_15565 [Terriglobales bacterium]